MSASQNVSSWEKVGLKKPNATDYEEHNAVGDVATGRRFKASQLVPSKYKEANDGTYKYYGFANFGSATSSALWRILRETIADKSLDAADSNDLFDNIWDNYASLIYG